MSSSINHIFIDMDGVLCDFISKAMDVHGAAFVPGNYPAGEWAVEKVLGIDEKEFWRRIDNASPNFWPELAPYPWKNELLLMASLHFPAMSILTSPSRHESCFSGKRQWAKKHLDPSTNMILCRTKHLLAREDRLLIDDSDVNYQKWEEAGGKAILFPRWWNTLHAKSDMPMIHVGMELQRLNDRATQAVQVADYSSLV